VRVHRAVSSIEGVTGMAILRAIAGGERDAGKLAQLRDRHCRQSEEEIAEQLSGHWREDHVFSLQQALQMYDAIEERIGAYEKEILRKLGEMERPEQQGKARRHWGTSTRREVFGSGDRSRSGTRSIG